MAEGIKMLTLDDAIALREKAKAGDAQAAVRYVQWSIWHRISRDSSLPRERKEVLFSNLQRMTKFEVEFHSTKPEPASGR